MRTTSALAMLLATSMLLCMIPVTNAGSAPTNGGIVNVSTDELGISARNWMPLLPCKPEPPSPSRVIACQRCEYHCAEGGTLRVDGGHLPEEHSLTQCNTCKCQSSLTLESDMTDGGFDLTIVAANGMNMTGWSVTGENHPAEDMSGSEHVLNFPAGISADYQLNFTLNPGSFADLVIDPLIIDDGNAQTNVLAYQAGPMNTMMAKELGTQFELNIDGTAHFEDATITGAVMITGASTSIDSHLLLVAH